MRCIVAAASSRGHKAGEKGARLFYPAAKTRKSLSTTTTATDDDEKHKKKKEEETTWWRDERAKAR